MAAIFLVFLMSFSWLLFVVYDHSITQGLSSALINLEISGTTSTIIKMNGETQDLLSCDRVFCQQQMVLTFIPTIYTSPGTSLCLLKMYAMAEAELIFQKMTFIQC